MADFKNTEGSVKSPPPTHIILQAVLLGRDSVVGIATGYVMDDRGVGVRVPVGSRIFSYPPSPDRLWGPPSLLSNVYRRKFPRQ
jgi:hypothetical protein